MTEVTEHHRDYALIVDDSRTAQIRLKRMLEKYDLDIVMVMSAEEALGYLSYRRPVVIFLDQNMKGMDGIDALKTIKANSHTATIPVIMYTSEKGDVFTGQARALGAIDVLSKGALQPSNLEHVLSKLKIAPAEKKPVMVERRASPPPASVSTTDIKSDLQQVREQMGRLLEIYIADVTRQISKSTQFIVKRISQSIEANNSNGPREIVVGDIPLSVLNDEVSAERRKISLVANGLLVVLLVGMVFLGTQLFSMKEELALAAERYEIATFGNELNTAKLEELTQTLNGSRTPLAEPAMNAALFNAISLAARSDFTYAYGEEPFNEKLLPNIQWLVYLLGNAGYRGEVELVVHSGNFCLSPNAEANLVPARGDTLLSDCQLRESLNQDYRADTYANFTYRQFEENMSGAPKGNIFLSLSSSGLSAPREAYPKKNAQTTAAEWNAIAQKNNFVEVRFPETGSRWTLE